MNSEIETLSRRGFFSESGGWLLGALVVAWDGSLLGKLARAATMTNFTPNLFVAITTDGGVTLVCQRSEMGQGIRTSIAMLLADELEVDWNSVKVVQANGDERFGDQNTDGSKSITLNWTAMREAGAAAREMLLQAAANEWKVPVASCKAKGGRIHLNATKKSLTYGELASAASLLAIPPHPRLKPDSELKLVGFPQSSVDIDAIINGKAVYGIDVNVPNMVYASLERSPTRAGKIRSLDASAASSLPGVISVIRMPMAGKGKYTNEAVAVVGTNTWSALQGRRALKIEWESGNSLNSADLRKALSAALDTPGKSYRSEGYFGAQEENAAKVVEARYTAPHLVHAPMEPPVCVAHVTEHECEIWAPTQDPQTARNEVAELLRLPVEKVTLHVTLLGGGFGRKSQPDFVLEAAALAKAVGRPVKLTWTREDEMRHGLYHPESAQALKATLDSKGNVTGWRHRSAFTTIMRLFNPNASEPGEFEMGQGCSNLPYRIPNISCEGAVVATDVRVAWLRSVCNIFHSFSVNSFLDEIAHVTGRDPVQLRLDMLEPHGIAEFDKKSSLPLDTGRLAQVIQTVAKESGWGRKTAKGSGIGFACHYSFKSYVALALEVRVHGKEIQVVRADCAIDCGKVVNPDSVRAQMEGSIVFGLSAALYGEITLKDGAVEQGNFHEYNVVRMPEAPRIHIYLVKSDAPPSGVGEPGVPPVAPALCAAIFKATGKRIRDLPVSRQL